MSRATVDWDDVKHAINVLTSIKTDDANMSEVATKSQTFTHPYLTVSVK